MTRSFVRRGTVTAAVLALTVAVLPVGSATAAPGSGWKVGECFAKADVDKDLVDLASAIACARPHAVQVLGGAALPQEFAEYSYAQLRDQKDTKLRARLLKFSEQICSGTQIAPGIWPKQGAAVAKALSGLAATTGGGILPAVPEGINFGWVFPDAKSFAAGDKSMLCVLYPLPVEGKTATLTGNAQLLGSSQALPKMRVCYTYDQATDQYALGSCALAHKDELLAYFAGRLPVAYDDMTDEQWAPLDKQCDAIVDALVGADRKDLRGYVDAAQTAAAGSLIYIQCYASKPKAADGTTPNLPGGTVVGLGKKPLKSA